ncbi:hypothetical protein QEG73_03025 [Chitinophagaceae bacterium 26-R-25]|nr:hypothetical protein [Chitinophagaceae bacterium 26-R-25]
MANRFYKWQLLLCLFVICSVAGNDLFAAGHKNKDLPVSPGKPTANHPFYISVTEINHNAKDKTLEISCKMFLDDFEKTLRDVTKTEVDLNNVKDKAKIDKLISNYLNSHLQLKVDGKPVSLQFIGFEKESEAAWCYLQVNNVPSVKQLEVKNTLLFEEFDSQISIMHVIVNGTRKSTRLNKPESVAKFDF